MRIATGLTPVLLASLCACTSRPDIQAGGSVSSEVAKALNSKDAAGLKSALAEDAVLLLTNQAILSGADAIASRYAVVFKQISYDISLSSAGIEPAGDLAVERGTIGGALKSEDGQTTQRVSGKYLHLMKWQAGRWKIWWAAWEFDITAAATSCDATGARSCCCKDIGGNDCIKRPDTGCGSDYPISILLP